jgi:hypothetical protein
LPEWLLRQSSETSPQIGPGTTAGAEGTIMGQFQFSTAGLLCSVMIIALMMGVTNSMLPNASTWTVATGGLSLTLLLFVAFCRLLGHSVARTFWLGVSLFLWGCLALQLADWWNLGAELRMLLAAMGVVYALWAWQT